MKKTRTAALLLLAGLVGCETKSGDLVNRRVGDRGQGFFSYVCVNADDAACANEAGPASIFPPSVAEGSQLRLAFTPPDDEAQQDGRPMLSPVVADYVRSVDGDIFTAVRPGFAGIVVRSSIERRVLDFTHLHVVPTSELRLDDPSRGPLPPHVTSTVGDSTYVRAVPIGVSGQVLAGAMACTWAASDEAVLQVQAHPPASGATVRAIGEGTARLTATCGAFQSTLDMEVQASP